MTSLSRSARSLGTNEGSPMPGLVVMLAVLGIVAVFLLLNSGISESFPYVYLLPWIIGLAIVFLLPIVYLYQKGRFEFYDPIVFAVGSYLFPTFVIGGLMLVTGLSQPQFINLIQDAKYNLPYTIVLVMLGFAGLSIGYLLPFGKRIGQSIEGFLPRWDFEPKNYVVPGIVLLIFGVANVLLAFAMGVLGYQKPEAITEYDGLIFMTTSLWAQASFLLLYTLFRRSKYDVLFFAVGVPVIMVSLIKALFSGNRGSLLQLAFVLGLAYFLAGGKLSVKRGSLAVIAIIAALFVGMIYGTTFRNLKGSESQVSMDRYAENIGSTLEYVGSAEFTQTIQFGLVSLAERLETLSSVAVVVSNYEQLAPYEEGYGLDNNVYRDLSTFLIPRFIWADKPTESDPRRYSDLYFNNAESSFVITPFGDLLRNFGPAGVFIGMFLLGIVIRTVYRALIEEQEHMTWRVMLYFSILTAISYEVFFSTIIPNMTKFGFTAVIGIIIVYGTARFLGYKRIVS